MKRSRMAKYCSKKLELRTSMKSFLKALGPKKASFATWFAVVFRRLFDEKVKDGEILLQEVGAANVHEILS